MLRRGLILGVLLIMAAGVLRAETLKAEAASAPKVTLEARSMSMTDALADLAGQAKVTVVTSALPDAKLTASLDEVPFEEALTLVCKVRKLTWRKVWAEPGPKGEFDAKKLAKAIRALEDLETLGVVVRDPESGITSVALRKIPAEAKVEPLKLPGAGALKEIYFISSKETEEANAAAKADPAATDPAQADAIDPALEADIALGGDDPNMPVDPVAAAARAGMYTQQKTAAMTALQGMGATERRSALKADMQLFKQMSPKVQTDVARQGLRMYMDMDPVTRNRLAAQVRREMRLPKTTPIPGANTPKPRRPGG